MTLALFQSDGVVPWCSEAWKTSVSAGVICSDVSRSRRVGSSSGPLALCGFKPDSSFSTPLGVTLMSGRSGVPLGPRSGVSVPFSTVKTEENWSFNMSAFSLGSSLGMPSFLSGEMPLLSHFLSFVRVNSFLLHLSSLTIFFNVAVKGLFTLSLA